MSKSHLSPGHLPSSNSGTPIWLVALAQSWPLFPLSTSQEPPLATCTHIPYTSMGLLPQGSPYLIHTQSWEVAIAVAITLHGVEPEKPSNFS